MIKIIRANKKHEKLKDEWVKRQTAFLAKKDQRTVGLFAYRFEARQTVQVIYFENCSEESHEKLFRIFLEELIYWHPYIKQIRYEHMDEIHFQENRLEIENIEGDVLTLKNPRPIQKVSIHDIVPEQLSIDQDKLQATQSWMTGAEDFVVSCVNIKGELVCIDGYSRLMAAYQKDIQEVNVCIEEGIDTSFYETCLSWCQAEHIHSIDDLSHYIISSEAHQERWIDRCQNYLKAKE